MNSEPTPAASELTSAQDEPPLVTVLMAVHDCAAFVDEAIGSILTQTFGDFEFLIIDDASTDGTLDRIAAYTDRRIRSFRNEARLGLTRSLNRGLSVARGALIARQDGDDRSHPSRLEAQVECFDREPDLVVLGTQARTIDRRGFPVAAAPWSAKVVSNRAIRWQLLFDNPFIHTSVMFRKREVWGCLGGYDETFATSQDFELWSRAAAAGFRLRNLASTLVDFRVHEGSVSGGYKLESLEKVRAVLLNTLMAQLGPEGVPAGWPDVWIRFTNPRVFPDADDPLEMVARDIGAIYRRFIETDAGAGDDDEIRRHATSMLIWLAYSGAGRGRRSSVSSLARAFQCDRMMTLRAAPRYLAHLAVGSWRGRRATRARRREEDRCLVDGPDYHDQRRLPGDSRFAAPRGSGHRSTCAAFDRKTRC